jgi:hypothetical protein
MGVRNNKIGAIPGLIGSVVLLMAGLYWISMGRMMYSGYPGFSIFIPYIIALITIGLSAFGITGCVLVFRDFQWGYIFLLIAGIVGIIGSFIPIYAYDQGYGYIQYFYLVNTAMYGDLALMVVGALLGFALAEKKERF